ncbi:MAG: hypothetical protein C0404_01335 [Verrucomicrobia bacterium]|nr:hypothetical protein [Verrucomicrobiota bacterium]
MGRMKTTLEIPSDLYRQAKIKAATDGCRIKDLVTDGLALVLGVSNKPAGKGKTKSAFDVLKDACGCVDSGVSDLASNPKHMKGFGRE